MYKTAHKLQIVRLFPSLELRKALLQVANYKFRSDHSMLAQTTQIQKDNVLSLNPVREREWARVKKNPPREGGGGSRVFGRKMNHEQPNTRFSSLSSLTTKSFTTAQKKNPNKKASIA